MKVAIIGGGLEGLAAAKYWRAKGADVTIHDRNESLKPAGDWPVVLGEDYLKGLAKYDLLVRSPGVRPRDIKATKPVTTGTREFFDRCPARIIGVTGTKGKGTTSSLIARIIGESGRRALLGGNIGKPALELLGKIKASDLVVLELSSFQLMDLDSSPHVAVCLMVAPEHLDWHKNVREYVTAKGNIFWHQHEEDFAVYNAKNEYSMEIAQLSQGTKVPYMKSPGARVANSKVWLGDDFICEVDEVGLIGPHNLENVCAAITATATVIGADVGAMRRAVMGFKGLEHRLELVGEAGGAKWYDDSFATTPETAIAAIRSFKEPKVLILGGSDKKSKYDQLAREVASANIRQVVLVGQMGERIGEVLRAAGVTDIAQGGGSMTQIVKTAAAAARRGDVVLLSPACASFDMFANYKDRGDQYKQAVLGLGKP